MNHTFITQISCLDTKLADAAQQCANALGTPLNTRIDDAQYHLIFGEKGVVLTPIEEKRHGEIYVDFCEGKNAHRRKFGGGKGQLIAKACGLKTSAARHILDATAGLGQDAFVLASLGCTMTLLERSPIAYALLADGLQRASAYAEQHDEELFHIISRMKLLKNDSIDYLTHFTPPAADIIYLDPMFPDKQKKAAVNKNMQAFHGVIGKDTDDTHLLNAALKQAHYRVVVKRPRLAPTIEGPKPSHTVEGKSSRYDIYTLKGMH